MLGPPCRRSTLSIGRRLSGCRPFLCVQEQTITNLSRGSLMKRLLTWSCVFIALVIQAGCQAAAAAKSEAESYAYTGRLSLDIAKVPFSRYGSILAFSKFTPDNLTGFHATGLPLGVYLRSVNGDQRTHPVF